MKIIGMQECETLDIMVDVGLCECGLPEVEMKAHNNANKVLHSTTRSGNTVNNLHIVGQHRSRKS